MIKRAYRRAVPASVRRSLWAVRNFFAYVFSDQLPQEWALDYESYWRQRLQERGSEISYPEIVDICTRIIPDGARVMDIGCGAGQFLLRLKQKKDVHELGLDVSQTAIEIASSHGLQAIVSDASVDDLARYGAFDFVTAFEVLEHIPNAEEVLVNVRREFPHATVIVSIPNTGYVASRMRLLMGRFPKQWHIHPSEHLRFWTLQDFQFMVNGLGYDVSQIIPLRGFPYLAKLRPGLFAMALIFVLGASSGTKPQRSA